MIQGYDIYFDKVLLPVAPPKIKTDIRNKNKTIELINDGEVNLLKTPGLTEISFTILLPNVKYPFGKYLDGFKNSAYFLGVFEQYKVSQKPFQFIISRTLPNGTVPFHTNLRMSLEDYSYEDTTAEGFDIKVTLNLKQYKDYGTKTVKITPAVNNAAVVSSAPKRAAGSGANNSGKAYTIKSGDTLSNIAKSKMGKASLWRTLYSANQTVIENAARARGKKSSNNGHWIYPGTVLRIPSTSPVVKKGASSGAVKAQLV